MRKKGKVGVASSIISMVAGVSLLSPTIAEAHFGNQLLHEGIRNQDVKELQEQLHTKGYFPLDTPTGYYGPITKKAVKHYQKDYDLHVDGIVGSHTFRVLHKDTQKAKPGKKIKVLSTAYTAYCEGCIGITKKGTNLRKHPEKKVIAVDPKVIPLGSMVYVEGYGTAIADDIGGAIDGREIDVFFAKESDALEWGRKPIHIKVLD
ncbi:3D domain-containing protein [Aneurinibacillus tyrosinisolvens]|uniref:3D domain-containing protein n=1 Tax=Aneurinibacillus tyrosinisolvens TaxID=1443435 RepID=UPI00063FBF6A|nr:3D domain-containing protein [Aneurinibacillus tyrosinisolvens]